MSPDKPDHESQVKLEGSSPLAIIEGSVENTQLAEVQGALAVIPEEYYPSLVRMIEKHSMNIISERDLGGWKPGMSITDLKNRRPDEDSVHTMVTGAARSIACLIGRGVIRSRQKAKTNLVLGKLITDPCKQRISLIDVASQCGSLSCIAKHIEPGLCVANHVRMLSINFVRNSVERLLA